jgi:hypothetical protein
MGQKQVPAHGRPSLKKGRSELLADEILVSLGENTVAQIYEQQIRPLRTRRFALNAPTKETRVEVFHTLLGIELKIGKRRLLCPDLATARFLSVFARFGIQEVAVPYEITRISHLADQLESAWFKMNMLIEPATSGLSTRMKNKVRRLLIQHERDEMLKAGAGPATPQFNQNTKQRRSK